MSDRPLCECHGEPMYTNGDKRRCAVKSREAQRRRYAENPGPQRERRRRNYAANLDREREQMRLYREGHREEIREAQRRYREEHREGIREARLRHYYNLDSLELARARLRERRRKALKRRSQRQADRGRQEAANG